jgi:hypothetical protein
MYEYLRQHPEIFMSEVKEPHFFGRDFTLPPRRCIRDEAEYFGLFADAGSAKRVGEGSVWYLYSKQAAREIHDYDPSARIIIMLRNPVDTLWSLHAQYLQTCNEEIVDFEEALAAEADRREGRRIPKAAHFPPGLLYKEAVTFSTQIRRYYDHFSREQVHVIIFDEFTRDTASVYREALSFLDVDTGFVAQFRVFNPTGPIRNWPLQRYVKTHPRFHRLAKAVSPLGLRRWAGEAMRSMKTPVPRPPQMDPAFRSRLQRTFVEEVAELGRLLDRDLSYWCCSE